MKPQTFIIPIAIVIAVVALGSMGSLPQNEPGIADNEIIIEPQSNNDNPLTISDNSIKYYIHDLPDYAQYDLTIPNVSQAFDEWSRLNPQLKFAEVDNVSKASISIQFVEEIEDIYKVNGIVDINLDTGFNEILIDIGNDDCNDNFVFWDFNTTRDTIKHEIGHILGLEHSSDETNLMHGTIETTLLFDNLGYSIPDMTAEDYYIGQEVLEKQFDVLDEEITLFDKRIDIMEETHNGTESGLNEIIEIINYRNGLATDQTTVYDKIICYPN